MSGDQLYNMDFRSIVDYAIDAQADMVIASQPVSDKDVSRFGVLKVDDESKLIDFYEKPQSEEILKHFRLSNTAMKNLVSILSTGIF